MKKKINLHEAEAHQKTSRLLPSWPCEIINTTQNQNAEILGTQMQISVILTNYNVKSRKARGGINIIRPPAPRRLNHVDFV